MTYARFLAIFLLPPLLVAVALAARRLGARHLGFLGGLSLVVLVWTSPWDNAAVAMGLWGFAPERVAGLFIGLLPVEEYAFFLLQTWIVSLFLMRRLMR